MILRRIRPSIEGLLRDSQFGFRPDRSTAGAQLLLNDLTARVNCTRGDMNSPLQTPQGGKCFSKRAKQFRKFLLSIGAKSAHECCSAGRKWTYRFPPNVKHPLGLTKQLDQIITNTRFSSAIRSQRVLLAPLPTRHCVVTEQLKIRWKAQSKAGKQVPFWGSLRNEVIKDKFVKNVEFAMEGGNKRTRDDAVGPLLWDKFASAVKNASGELPSRVSNHNTNKDEAPGPGELDLKAIVKVARNPHRFDAFSRAHAEKIGKCIKEECNVLAEDLYKHPKSAYRTIRNIVGDNRKEFSLFGEIFSVRDSLRTVQNHFQAIGQEMNTGGLVNFPLLTKSLIEIQDGEFTLSELRSALLKVKSGKAAGSDGIPIEALRSLSANERLMGTLLHIVNDVRSTGIASDKWKMILQVTLPKKGNLGNLSNWRPVCIVNHVVKIMNRMVFLDGIQPAVENMLRPNQFGFRPHRSTAGAQATFVEISAKALSGQGVAVAFVDFKQAFPSVPFSAIVGALNAFHIPEHLTKVNSTQESDDRNVAPNERLRLGWAVMHKLRSIWKSPLPMSSRMTVFRTLVMPVVNYNAGTWDISTSKLRELDIEMNKMRRMVCNVGRTWDGKRSIRLEALYQNDLKLSTTAKAQRAQLIGHILRHDSPFSVAILWRE